MTKLQKRDDVALANYAREINATHALAKAHAEMAVVLAVRTGLLCVQAKEIVGHGGFESWLKCECPTIHANTARNYMRLVGVTKSTTVVDLPRAELVAPDFAERVEAEEYRDGLVARVRASVGDGTLTQLYHAYGVIAPRVGNAAAANTKPLQGLYTPHAVRLDFDRALRQTVERVPLADWSAEMCEAWLRELQPIVSLCDQLRRRAKSAA